MRGHRSLKITQVWLSAALRERLAAFFLLEPRAIS